jgi:hypothetical protein
MEFQGFHENLPGLVNIQAKRTGKFIGLLMEYSWIEISIDLEIHILMGRSTGKHQAKRTGKYGLFL